MKVYEPSDFKGQSTFIYLENSKEGKALIKTLKAGIETKEIRKGTLAYKVADTIISQLACCST